MIVITVNNRPRYLGETLESWREVEGIQDEDIAYFIEPGPNADVCNELCRRADYSRGRHVICNDKVYGALTNPWRALDYGFYAGHRGDNNFVILGEDDAVVSKDVLNYFSWCAEKYQKETVLAVCSFQQEKYELAPRNGVILKEWFAPTVWGTWRDRWWMMLRDTWDHDYSSGDGDPPQRGGWDWNINLRILPSTSAPWSCAFPLWSRSQHIGKENGTHMLPENFEEHLSQSFDISRNESEFVEVVV